MHTHWRSGQHQNIAGGSQIHFLTAAAGEASATHILDEFPLKDVCLSMNCLPLRATLILSYPLAGRVHPLLSGVLLNTVQMRNTARHTKDSLMRSKTTSHSQETTGFQADAMNSCQPRKGGHRLYSINTLPTLCNSSVSARSEQSVPTTTKQTALLLP